MDTLFNIGDKVSFLNDIGGGKISGFQKGGVVLVEDEDGFEVPVRAQELVLVNNAAKESIINTDNTAKNATKTPLKNHVTSNSPISFPSKETEAESIEERIIRLERMIKKMQLRIEELESARSLRDKLGNSNFKVEKFNHKETDSKHPLEIDLHATELLDSLTGMDNKAILDYQLDKFRQTMNANLKNKTKKIIFIHGNGNGVLRQAIIKELRQNYPKCEYQDASYQQYGFGATMVTIH